MFNSFEYLSKLHCFLFAESKQKDNHNLLVEW